MRLRFLSCFSRFPLHQIRQTGSTQLSFPVVARGGSVLIASSFDTRMSGPGGLHSLDQGWATTIVLLFCLSKVRPAFVAIEVQES